MAVEEKPSEPSPESRNRSKFRIRIFLKIKIEPTLFFDYFCLGFFVLDRVNAIELEKDNNFPL
jgi:hypothetical protein